MNLKLEDLAQIVEKAGQLALHIQRAGDFQETVKEDHSPVTEADWKAHHFLLENLPKLLNVPVVSEENAMMEKPPVSERYWLVDPLDGTRGFIEGKPDWVVSVALIEAGKPITGAIAAPVFEQVFWAQKGEGAFKNWRRIFNDSRENELVAYSSGYHNKPRGQRFVRFAGISQVLKLSSALKFCLLAEGGADLYPRFGETYEWDTAGGQVLLEEAGCELIDLESLRPMSYGKPGRLNKGFVAARVDLNIAERIADFRKQEIHE